MSYIIIYNYYYNIMITATRKLINYSSNYVDIICTIFFYHNILSSLYKLN